MTENPFRLPSAAEFKGYYDLLIEILNDTLRLSKNIADGGARANRFAKMEDLHKSVECIHEDYLNLFDSFSRRLWQIKICITDGKTNRGHELVDEAILDFRENCMARRQDRAAAKSIASVSIESASDLDESKDLAPVLSFRHDFELGKTNVFMPGIEDAFTRNMPVDLESSRDGAGTHVDEKISAMARLDDDRQRIDEILDLIRKADRALNIRLGQIVRHHQNLRRSWRMTALAHDRKGRSEA